MAMRISKTMWFDAQVSATHQNLIAGLPGMLSAGEEVVVYDEAMPGEPVLGRLKLDSEGGIVLVPLATGGNRKYPVEPGPSRIPMDVPPAEPGPSVPPENGDQDPEVVPRAPFKNPAKSPKKRPT